MKVELENLLLACELSHGHVKPVAVLALCEAVRLYAAIVQDMAGVIGRRVATDADLTRLADAMERARTALLEDGN